MTATEVRIDDGSDTAKLRDPIAVALLDLITLGAYGFAFFPVGAGYVQSHLNRVWAKQGAIGEPEARPGDSELVASS